MEKIQKKKEAFRTWLAKNTYGRYGDYEIEHTTQLVRYEMTISVIVLTFTINTGYYFIEAEKGKAAMAFIFAQMVTLLLGWWGLPWGPINTIKTLVTNFSGGEKVLWIRLVGFTKEREESK